MGVVIPASVYRSGKQQYMTRQKAREGVKVRIKSQDWLMAALGLLMGQAMILDGLAPFGVAYLTVFAGLHPQRLAVISLGVGIGSALSRGWTGVGMVLMGLVGVYIIRRAAGLLGNALKSLTMAGLTFALHMVRYVFAGSGDFYQLVMGLLEPLLIFCVTWLFVEGLTEVFQGSQQRLARHGVIAGLFLIAGVLTGLPRTAVGGLMLMPVVANAVLLTVASAGGIAAGTTFGLFIGLVMALPGAHDPLLIGMYGFAGLTAGFFRDYGKLVTVLGLVLPSLIFAGLGLSTITLSILLVENLIAGAIFFILPNSVLTNFRRYLPGTGELLIQETNYMEELQQKFTERLGEISQVFSELGTTFKEVTAADEEAEDDLSYFLYIVSSRICKGCEYARHCWDQQFYQTYTQIFKLLTVMEAQGQASGEDFVKILKGHCRNLSRLKNSIDGTLEIYEVHRNWSGKLKKQQAIVAEQLAEVSTIIDGFSKEWNLGATHKEDLERTLKSRMEECGIKVAHCRIAMETGDDQLAINVAKERCMGESECRKVFQIVGQMVPQPMTNYERECGYETGQAICRLKYCPARKFKVNAGFYCKPKNGETVSGDSFVYQLLKSGKFMSILSDGMGTGEDAARESRTATRLVQQIIRAGFNHDLAVRTVNSALLSRSTDECYATLDLAFVDLFTGELELIKIGAVDSFIKRGSEVNILRGGSLPAGILQTVEPLTIKRRLLPGDFVVMVTDGVMDAISNLNKEEIMTRILRQCNFESPDDLARYIYDQVKLGGLVEDDMTVVVLKLDAERVH